MWQRRVAAAVSRAREGAGEGGTPKAMLTHAMLKRCEPELKRCWQKVQWRKRIKLRLHAGGASASHCFPGSTCDTCRLHLCIPSSNNARGSH